MDEDFDMPPADEMMEDEFGIPDLGPTLKVGEEKEIGKQGLKKKLVKEGESWETPENGDEVEVHYTGTLLDGTQFDSSRDRGTPFKFTLGQGFTEEGFGEVWGKARLVAVKPHQSHSTQTDKLHSIVSVERNSSGRQ